MATRVLIAGESWVTHSIHQKGFDSFTTTTYCEGVEFLRTALLQVGCQVDFIPNHLAPTNFPSDMASLKKNDVVILSDIGSNTLLLHPDTFGSSVSRANRLTLLRDYVALGGGLIMVGGYLTFQGIEGRARYAGTAVEEALPVTILPYDDRVEVPEGCPPAVVRSDHPAMAGLPGTWPSLLGYNRVLPKAGSTLVATVSADPLLVTWDFGDGRAAAFTSDCGPHWCPPQFVQWPGYNSLWQQLVGWVAQH